MNYHIMTPIEGPSTSPGSRFTPIRPQVANAIIYSIYLFAP